MSDFSEKVNELLSNPESLSKIMQIAQSIGLGGNQAEPAATAMATPPPAAPPPAAPPPAAPPPAQTMSQQTQFAPPQAMPTSAPAPAVQAASTVPASDGLGALSGLLGNAGALAPLLTGTASSDKRVALLKALKPFMTDAKQKRVDNVISAISISSTLNKFKPERS